MFLNSFANKPASVTVYNAELTAPLTGFDSGKTFIYLADQAKWAEFVDEAPFGFYVDYGDYNGDISIKTFADTACTQELSKEITWQNNADPYAKAFMIRQAGWDPNSDTVTIQIKLLNTTKVILDAGIGWDDHTLNYAIPIMGTAVIKDDGRTLEYTYSAPDDLDHFPHDMHLAVGYPDSGNAEIADKANDYLYAYDTSSVAETKNHLAQEMYDRFFEVSMYESFGLDTPGPDDDDATRLGKRVANIPRLESRIQTKGDPYEITVTLADGTTETRNAQDYEISWGLDSQNGNPVKSVIPVYLLEDNNEFLICTDFDKSTGKGSTFYSRIVHQDEIDFSNVEGNHDWACVIYADSVDSSKVMAGGNGSEMSIQNTEGMVSFEIATRYPEWGRFANWGTHCRILIPSETYVVINGEGEDKNYDGLGVNAHSIDNVWKTGDGSEARVYIGYSSIYLEPLGAGVGGVNTKVISSVTLDDPSLAGGVTISGVDANGKVKITFASNFYDRVPVTINYTNGAKESIVIVRVGLVIQYSYLFDQGEGVHTGEIGYDCKPGEHCDYTYDYLGKGEQIIIYATYYHPTNDHTAKAGSEVVLNLRFADGTSRVISSKDDTRNFNGHLDATAEAVATTSFIIGFAPAKIQNPNGFWTDNIVSQTYKEGPFYATVLNAGYNDATTYGGTQSGSGKGVYWDGLIEWFN